MALHPARTLLADLDAVVAAYAQQLRSLAQAVRVAPQNDSDAQAGLLLCVDPLFATDKALQECLRKGVRGAVRAQRAVNEQQALLDEMHAAKEQAALAEQSVDRLLDRLFAETIRRRDLLERQEGRLAVMRHISERGLDVGAVAALGERLSLTSGPPDDWQPDQPLVLHRPPYPTEDLMRASLLFRLMNVPDPAAPPAAPIAPLARPAAEPAGRVGPADGAEPSGLSLDLLDLDLNPDLL